MNMKLEKIIEQVGLYIEPRQLKYFCKDEELTQTINVLERHGNLPIETFEKLLIENQDSLDLEKLLLMIIYNYYNDASLAEKILNDEKKLYGNIGIKLDQKELKERKEKVNKQYINLKKLLQKAQKLGKNIDKVITLYNYDENQDKFWLEIIDSKEYINGKKRSNSKNLKRYNDINKQLKTSSDLRGIEYIFSAINFSDFEVMCIDEDFGYLLKTQILDNKAVKDGIISSEELNKIRQTDFDAYNNVYKKIDLSNTLGVIKENVEKYIQYFDINKMLLTCAYRLEEKMEEKMMTNDIRKYIEVIYNNVKDDKKEYIFDLYFKDGEEWTKKEVTYSADKLKKFLDRFTKDSYLTESEIQEKRDRIVSGEINLFDTGKEANEVIFTNEQLEEVALLSDENLAYVAIILNWDKDQIIEKIQKKQKCSAELLDTFIKHKKIAPKDVTNLYIFGIVDPEQIEKLRVMTEEIDWSQIVDSNELIKYYYQSIKNDATELDIQRYNKYAELYKTIKMENEEDKEKNEKELMEILINGYNQEEKQEYIDIQEDLFGKGILSVDSLKVLNNGDNDVNSIISNSYIKGTIELNQIIELTREGKLKFEFFEELASNEGLEKNKRMEMLRQGVVEEETILILFLNDYINENDLLHLADLNIINKPKAESMIRNKNNPDNSQFVITISGNLKKINYKLGGNQTTEEIDTDEKNKTIIDPNIRLEYLDLLGAKKVDNVRIPKDSPFYEYEFFMLRDENGEYSSDSVVIAERFYEETEAHIKQKIEAEIEQMGKPKTHYFKYATDNATYFFKGRDIIALKEYTNKSEAVGNDKIIFKVDHNLADDSKVGSWAFGVLYAITKAMLSNDFKGLTKREQRELLLDTMKKYYGHKKFMEILDKGAEIDRGEHNGDIKEEYEDVVL